VQKYSVKSVIDSAGLV